MDSVMPKRTIQNYIDELSAIKEAGLYKEERIISSPQGVSIKVGTDEVLNFCANNYLGLANHPDLIAAAKRSLDERGYGLSSVRFICGTQDIHKELENKLAEFVGMEDSILYSSCFDANGGLFETLLTKDDAIISDELNHASIIDGIRLSKAARHMYKHSDMNALEDILKSTHTQQKKMIATDGVFSMDGEIARLKDICFLADKYTAFVMIDDSHGTGFMGKNGRGSHEYCDVLERVDIITSTLGKTMGGASGGFTASRKEIVGVLRQRSRPYLYSNSVPPMIVSAAIACVGLLKSSGDLRNKLLDNTAYFKKKMADAGFNIKSGVHPIVQIMLGDLKLARDFARDLYDEGIYVVGFGFPVVPKGTARIRVQVSAAHEREHLDHAVEKFVTVGKKYTIV